MKIVFLVCTHMGPITALLGLPGEFKAPWKDHIWFEDAQEMQQGHNASGRTKRSSM